MTQKSKIILLVILVVIAVSAFSSTIMFTHARIWKQVLGKLYHCIVMAQKSKGILLVTLVVIAVSALFSIVLLMRKSHAGIWKQAIVKLYSDGQVVGTWEAVDLGKVEGNSLVFTIQDNKKVRICGTYSVESSDLDND